MKSIQESNAVMMHQTIEPFHNWQISKGFRDESLRGYQMDIKQPTSLLQVIQMDLY